FASSLCAPPPNAPPRATPLGGTYCVLGRSSRSLRPGDVDVGTFAATGTLGVVAFADCGVLLAPLNSSADGMLKLGRGDCITSRICADDMLTVAFASGTSGGGGGGGGAAGGGAGSGVGGSGAAAGTAGRAAMNDVASPSSSAPRLGDGTFLRIASVSTSRPVVKTSSWIDAASSFPASSAVASMNAAAASLSLIIIGTRIARVEPATPRRVERLSPSQVTTVSSRNTRSSSGINPGAALKRFT